MSPEYKDFIGKATETDDKLRPTGKELITHPFLARRATAAEVGAIAARASAAKAAKADEPEQEQEEEELEQEDEVPVWNANTNASPSLYSSSPPVTSAPPRPVKPTVATPVKRSLPNPGGFKKGPPDTPKKVPVLPGKTGKKMPPPMPAKGPPKLQPPPPPIQETPFEPLDPPASPVDEEEDAWSD